jgi:hypothetical protein
VKGFLEKIMVKYGLKVEEAGSSFYFTLPNKPLVQKILRYTKVNKTVWF